MSIPIKAPGQSLSSVEINEIVRPGISIAQITAGGLTPQALTTTYTQIALTNIVVFESPTGVITTTHPGGLDTITCGMDGLYKFSATLFIEGPTNTELHIKAFLNGVEVTAGDPTGVNLLGSNKPMPMPFIGAIPLTVGDIVTYYARFDAGTGSITVDGGSTIWERTNY